MSRVAVKPTKKPALDYDRIWEVLTLNAYEFCAQEDEDRWSCNVGRIERETRTTCLDVRELDAHLPDEWSAEGAGALRRYTYRYNGTTRAARRARALENPVVIQTHPTLKRFFEPAEGVTRVTNMQREGEP